MQVEAGIELVNANPEKTTHDSAPRGRPRRQPSRRNLELYFELVCEGRRQTEVALRFRVSQPRVAQIRADVAGWVDEMLGGRAGEGSAGLPPEVPKRAEQFHLAVALRRIHIEAAYERY